MAAIFRCNHANYVVGNQCWQGYQLYSM